MTKRKQSKASKARKQRKFDQEVLANRYQIEEETLNENLQEERDELLESQARRNREIAQENQNNVSILTYAKVINTWKMLEFL